MRSQTWESAEQATTCHVYCMPEVGPDRAAFVHTKPCIRWQSSLQALRHLLFNEQVCASTLYVHVQPKLLTCSCQSAEFMTSSGACSLYKDVRTWHRSCAGSCGSRRAGLVAKESTRQTRRPLDQVSCSSRTTTHSRAGCTASASTTSRQRNEMDSSGLPALIQH
jgi:hypothetical protein